MTDDPFISSGTPSGYRVPDGHVVVWCEPENRWVVMNRDDYNNLLVSRDVDKFWVEWLERNEQ